MEGKNKMIEEARRKRSACARHRAKSVRSASGQARNDLSPSPLEGWGEGGYG